MVAAGLAVAALVMADRGMQKLTNDHFVWGATQ
jgi:hypothetical protein